MNERANIIAPLIGRLQELLGAIIEREVQIPRRCRPAAGDAARTDRGAGRVPHQFTGPMNQAMRTGEGAAIVHTLEATDPAGADRPGRTRRHQVPGRSPRLAEIGGMPARLRRSGTRSRP